MVSSFAEFLKKEKFEIVGYRETRYISNGAPIDAGDSDEHISVRALGEWAIQEFIENYNPKKIYWEDTLLQRIAIACLGLEIVKQRLEALR